MESVGAVFASVAFASGAATGDRSVAGLFHAEPLRNGWAPEGWLLPLAVATALLALGSLVFTRRDLR